VDDSTFDLRLARPFSPILGVISAKYCSVVPREAVQFYGKDFRRHPCGTGPFQLARWDEGQSLVLRKNPRYFEKDLSGRRLPYLEAVQVSFQESKATEFLLFRQGRIDFMNDIDPSFKDEVLNKRGELKKQWVGKIQLQKHPYLNTEYLGILTDTLSPLLAASPLKQRAVRRAINMGFDRRKLMFYLRNSIGFPAESGFVPQGLPSFDSSIVRGYRYNPEQARALLRTAGFGNGNEMPSVRLLTIPIYADLAGFIARQLEETGMHVQVEAIPKSLLLEQTAQSRALFFRASWIADYPDAENFLSVFYSKNPAPPNYTRYANREYDALYEQAIQTTDDSVRRAIYQQMDRILIRDAPVVPLWYDEVIRLVQPGVSGFFPNSLNLLELKSVQKKNTLN
jgi:peptide/nickel transport system substrate-binding protein